MAKPHRTPKELTTKGIRNKIKFFERCFQQVAETGQWRDLVKHAQRIHKRELGIRVPQFGRMHVVEEWLLRIIENEYRELCEELIERSLLLDPESKN